MSEKVSDHVNFLQEDLRKKVRDEQVLATCIAYPDYENQVVDTHTGIVVVVRALPDLGIGRTMGDLFELVAAVVFEQSAQAAAIGGIRFADVVAVVVVAVGNGFASRRDLAIPVSQ